MMGRLKLRGVLIGLMGNAAIAWSLFHLLQIGSCGGAGVPACPADAWPYFVALPVGILVSVLGIFMGGGAIAFCGVCSSPFAWARWPRPRRRGGGESDLRGGSGCFTFFGLAPCSPRCPAPMSRRSRSRRFVLIATVAGVGTLPCPRHRHHYQQHPRVEIVIRIDRPTAPRDRADKTAPCRAWPCLKSASVTPSVRSADEDTGVRHRHAGTRRPRSRRLPRAQRLAPATPERLQPARGARPPQRLRMRGRPRREFETQRRALARLG